MENYSFNKAHFTLNSIATPQNFTTPSRNIQRSIIPEQPPESHGRRLRGDLALISTQLNTLKDSIADIPLQMGIGIQVEFDGFPDVDLAFESLANATHGIDLHNIKKVEDNGSIKTIATVFIPDGKLIVFENKITQYLSGQRHKNLINTIQSIRTAAFSAIWSDDDIFLPENNNDLVWWEVWLSTPKRTRENTNNYIQILSDFTLIANEINIEVSNHKLLFPEHTVIQIKATKNQLANNTILLSSIAEIRYPKVTAEFFDSADCEEQEQWSSDLLNRLYQSNNDRKPYVCIIDSGVNVTHPLLSPFASRNDQSTVTDDNDPTDNNGHGTEMAGLAMWGDLTDILGSTEDIFIGHKLESVKTLNHSGDNEGKPLGLITSDAVSEVELSNPDRSRTFSMSLSSGAGTSDGRPSSWSSALDSLAVDVLGEGENPRLFTICAGNAVLDQHIDYPNDNLVQAIHDPAQAWNAITVGAYTNKVTISESTDYQPVAAMGNLSPYSTTSLVWNRRNAPIKPEVVFEGGNLGQDDLGCMGMQDLHLLSTHSDFSQRHFQSSNATSAATALGARFTAQVKAEYPDLWPETIRALTIHSASWTDEMFQLISAQSSDMSIRKTAMGQLIRMVGFGVPNIQKALKSANNSLSIVIQDELKPFHKEDGTIKTKDMHLHELPWPVEALQAISEESVELTITLSYFIEPNPSSRNILNKYNYASHQLRFDVKHHGESDSAFQRRINAAAEGDKPETQTDSNWLLGVNNRNKGSIHKDIWRGSAAELAERGKIAIYPANGWWRTRSSHIRWDSTARYSLVVSLSVPDVDVDIYSEVETKISAMVRTSSIISVDT
jgi:hypothetical protein